MSDDEPLVPRVHGPPIRRLFPPADWIAEAAERKRQEREQQRRQAAADASDDDR